MSEHQVSSQEVLMRVFDSGVKNKLNVYLHLEGGEAAGLLVGPGEVGKVQESISLIYK